MSKFIIKQVRFASLFAHCDYNHVCDLYENFDDWQVRFNNNEQDYLHQDTRTDARATKPIYFCQQCFNCEYPWFYSGSENKMKIKEERMINLRPSESSSENESEGKKLRRKRNKVKQEEHKINKSLDHLKKLYNDELEKNKKLDEKIKQLKNKFIIYDTDEPCTYHRPVKKVIKEYKTEVGYGRSDLPLVDRKTFYTQKLVEEPAVYVGIKTKKLMLEKDIKSIMTIDLSEIKEKLKNIKRMLTAPVISDTKITKYIMEMKKAEYSLIAAKGQIRQIYKSKSDMKDDFFRQKVETYKAANETFKSISQKLEVKKKEKLKNQLVEIEHNETDERYFAHMFDHDFRYKKFMKNIIEVSIMNKVEGRKLVDTSGSIRVQTEEIFDHLNNFCLSMRNLKNFEEGYYYFKTNFKTRTRLALYVDLKTLVFLRQSRKPKVGSSIKLETADAFLKNLDGTELQIDENLKKLLPKSLSRQISKTIKNMGQPVTTFFCKVDKTLYRLRSIVRNKTGYTTVKNETEHISLNLVRGNGIPDCYLQSSNIDLSDIANFI